MISLLDNTVMSNSAIVRRSDLLRASFGDKLATSQQPFDELRTGVAAGILPDLDWTWLPVWNLKRAEMSRYRQMLRRLNAGEAACLAMAMERECRVLTDDRDAVAFSVLLRYASPPLCPPVSFSTRRVLQASTITSAPAAPSASYPRSITEHSRPGTNR